MISHPPLCFVQLCGRFEQSGGSELWATWGTDNQEEKSWREEHNEHKEQNEHKDHKEQSGCKKHKDQKEAPTLCRWLSGNQVEFMKHYEYYCIYVEWCWAYVITMF